MLPAALVPLPTLTRSCRADNASSLRLLHSRIKAIEPYIDGTVPAAVVGLVHSEQTRLRYGSYDRSSYLGLMEKIFEAFRERSVSVLVLSSLDLTTPETLEGLELLVLPETSGLSAAQLAGLEAFVRAGGQVLASGDALRFNASGYENPGGQFSGGLLGVSWKETQCWQTEHAWALTWQGAAAETVESSAVCINVVDTGGAGVETALSGSIPGVTPGGPFKLLTTRRLGEGRVAYLSLKYDNSVGPGWPSTAGQASLTAPTLVSAIDHLVPEQPLRVSPPNASAAVLLTSQPASGRWLLHFLTPELVDVELSPQHVNASAVAEMVPPSGWEVRTTRSDSGGMRVRVVSIGEAERNFRLLVLKTDEDAAMNLTVRRQHKSRAGRYGWNIVDSLESINPARTALVIVDMWERYWCPSDAQAQVALAALINLTATKARERGILVVHAPSDTLPFYNQSQARKWVEMLPKAPLPHMANRTLPPYPLVRRPHTLLRSVSAYLSSTHLSQPRRIC